MLECYKKRKGTLYVCEYLVRNLDTGFIYGVGQDNLPTGPEGVMLQFPPQDREILKQIRDHYFDCPLDEVFTHESFWMFPPAIIAEIKTQKHAQGSQKE